MSENGYTSDEIGYHWIHHFHALTKDCAIRKYRPIAMDNHPQSQLRSMHNTGERAKGPDPVSYSFRRCSALRGSYTLRPGIPSLYHAGVHTTKLPGSRRLGVTALLLFY
jgi:hypothetical protein